MEPPDQLSIRPDFEPFLEVIDGLGESPNLVGENPPIQPRCRDVRAAFDRPGVALIGLIGAAQGIVGQRAVVMCNSRFRLDRQASPEVGNRVFEATEVEAAKAVVEVGPEILRPQVERATERPGGRVDPTVAQFEAAKLVILPC